MNAYPSVCLLVLHTTAEANTVLVEPYEWQFATHELLHGVTQ